MPRPPFDREKILPVIYAGVAAGRALSRVIKDAKDNPDMPDHSTFWDWHAEDEKIRHDLAEARLNGVEAIMDECLEIADETPSDDTRVAVERAKLKINTRMKYAQMIAPRKYGPRVAVDTTEGGGKIVILGGLPDGGITGLPDPVTDEG